MDNLHLTASEAFERSKKVGPSGTGKADELNYNLTITRVMAAIAASIEAGDRRLAFVVPWYILDGTSTDEVMLARQIKIRLEQLDFVVKRKENVLYIDWDIDLRKKENELKKKKEQQYRNSLENDRKNLKEAKRISETGTRPRKKIHPPLARRIKESENSNKRKAKDNTTVTVTRKKKK